MTPSDFATYPRDNLCNTGPRVRALAPVVTPLIPGMRIAGFAHTERITPGENSAIQRAFHNAQAGDLLVVSGGDSMRFEPFSDLLAVGCIAKGMVGAVFDCTIRDSADIAALGFQVFYRGFHPEATAKTEPGEPDIAVVVGGVEVCPGDIVVGDDDGVVLLPRDVAAEVLAKVARMAAREETIRARIHSGEITLDIFELAQ